VDRFPAGAVRVNDPQISQMQAETVSRSPHTPDVSSPRVIVLMGVAGAGKTTVGRRLAASLGWPFADADDYHPAENVARMRRGEPLTDAERAPWLAALAALVGDHVRRDVPLVLACSALRHASRDVLAPATFVYLRVSPAVLAERLATRAGHFAPPALLDSQLATLEPPDHEPDTITVDGERSPDELVAGIRAALGI
jgi:gluconokinase